MNYNSPGDDQEKIKRFFEKEEKIESIKMISNRNSNLHSNGTSKNNITNILYDDSEKIIRPPSNNSNNFVNDANEKGIPIYESIKTKIDTNTDEKPKSSKNRISTSVIDDEKVAKRREQNPAKKGRSGSVM